MRMDELDMIRLGIIPDEPIIEVVDSDGHFVKHLMLSEMLELEKKERGESIEPKYFGERK